jgi:hypothetical protein
VKHGGEVQKGKRPLQSSSGKRRKARSTSMDITAIMKRAKKLMLKYGNHPPVVLIESKREVSVSVLKSLPDTNLDKKKLLFTIGHDLAMEHDIEPPDVQQLVWICEMWYLSNVREEDIEKVPDHLERVPGRKEGLMVLTLNIDKERGLSHECRYVEVLRAGGTVDLLPGIVMDDVHSGLLTACLAGVCSASL